MHICSLTAAGSRDFARAFVSSTVAGQAHDAQKKREKVSATISRHEQ